MSAQRVSALSEKDADARDLLIFRAKKLKLEPLARRARLEQSSKVHRIYEKKKIF